MRKIKTGLICSENSPVGNLKIISAMEHFHITGYSGCSEQESFSKFNIPYISDMDALIQMSDAIILFLSPDQQFEPAKKTLKNSKHLFIEEPLTTNREEAETLLSMQREADVKVQVGSGMRLHRAFTESNAVPLKPQYIEIQNFSSKTNEASVVLDMMIHDLDFVLFLTKSEVRSISAHGVNVSGNTPGIVNARIEFGNGCVASLTANRIAKNTVHTTGIYEKDHSLLLDFNHPLNNLQPEAAYNIGIPKQATEKNNVNEKIIKASEVLLAELDAFYHCIVNNSVSISPLSDGCRALKLAYQILEKIEERSMEI